MLYRSPRPAPGQLQRVARLALGLLATALAACGSGGGELRSLSAPIGEGLMVRGLFAGDELVYAFVAAPELRVMTLTDPERAAGQVGLAWCVRIEDGLFLDGERVERPAGAPVFAVRPEGAATAIELEGRELAALSRELRLVRGDLGDVELAARLRAGLAAAGGS